MTVLSFHRISNNAENGYGVCSIVRNEFSLHSIQIDTYGRSLSFDIENVTFSNVYLPSGTDQKTRALRENYISETLPNLLINRKSSGLVGGDWNSIIDKKDCTRHPDQKMSPSLKRLVNIFNWKDSFRSLYPDNNTYSRYYSLSNSGEGATRIDRCYHYGVIQVTQVSYVSVAFSDHMSQIVEINLPEYMTRSVGPKSRPLFKVKQNIASDLTFKERLKEEMIKWKKVRELGVSTLTWWEDLVKPGIRKLAINRGKEINKERRGKLNLLMLRQAYLTRKIQQGEMRKLAELKSVHLLIDQWYKEECERVKYQARVKEVQEA